MRVARNLVKYTLGLPILLFVTFGGVMASVVFFVLGEDEIVIIDSIKETWKPLK